MSPAVPSHAELARGMRMHNEGAYDQEVGLISILELHAVRLSVRSTAQSRSTAHSRAWKQCVRMASLR